MPPKSPNCEVERGELEVMTETPVIWPVDLPTELVFEIFRYLPQADLARACRVSQYCMSFSWRR